MFNWNAHLRGAGFPPFQPQQLMPGSHMAQMSFQHQAPHWAQHQQPGMGMIMGPGWPQAGQPSMFPPHGHLPGVMTMPMTTMMGDVGPAPPSQPPPPLPAEPPPSSPKVPPPPPPTIDSASPVKPEKNKSKWDQPNREQPSSAGNTAPPPQPKPPESPASGQPKPPDSPAPGQPKPPESPASGQPKPPQSSNPSQTTSSHNAAPGTAQNNVNPVQGQVNLRGSASSQGNPRSSVPAQVHPRGPALSQTNLRGQAPIQINIRGSLPGQTNPHISVTDPPGLAPEKVNPHNSGQDHRNPNASGQINLHVPAQGHANLGDPLPGQVNPHGPPSGQANSSYGPVAGQVNPTHTEPTIPSVPAAEKTMPDPVLLTELEKVRMEESVFMEQYKQWKNQYDEWREQNQNHPNKEQFEQYLDQWKTYEQQMEIRRKGILMQKQNIEDKLIQQHEASTSKTGPVLMGTGSKLNTSWDKDCQNTPSISPSSQGFSVSSHDRESRLVKPQRADDSVSGHLHSTGGTGPDMSGRMNQFEKAENGVNPPLDLHNKGSGTVEEEKGEEDMNLDDDDEEEGGGGIIESARSVWPEKPSDNNSCKQHPSGDLNSLNQVPDVQGRGQWGNQRHNFGESARGTGWYSQRGFQEPGRFRGMGRGDQRDPFGSEVPGVDSDSRFPRSAAGGSEVQVDEVYAEKDVDGYKEVDDVQVDSIDDIHSNYGFIRGHPGIDSEFQRGRGGEFIMGRGDFLRGRGGDFQRGRGSEYQRGSGAEFQMGRGAEFQMGRGAEFQRGMGGEFIRGKGAEFIRGRGAEFVRGSGAEFVRGRGAEFVRGRGAEFIRGRGAEFLRGRGAEFLRGRGAEFERDRGSYYESEDREGMFDHSLDFERERFFPQDRRGFPPGGRGGLPSLLSFNFSENVRHRFADFEPGDEEICRQEEGLRGDINFGHMFHGQEGVRGKEEKLFFDDDDDDDRFFPPHGRGPGVVRGRGMGGVRGSSTGLVPEQFGRDNQTDMSLAQRGRGAIHSRGGTVWRGNLNYSSFTDSQRGEDNDRHCVQPGRAASGGEGQIDPIDVDKFDQVNQFEKSEFGFRDKVSDSMSGQRVDPEKSMNDSTWHDQQEGGLPERYDQRNQQAQVSETAAGVGQMSDRVRNRQVPGEDEPEVKKRRLSQDEQRDDMRIHKPSNTGDPYRDRQPYGDYRGSLFRDPYLDPYAVRHPYDLERPGIDRYGPKSSVYEPRLERKAQFPAESIDYGHGEIGREKKVVQPAEVIDYGHGQSHEGKAAEFDLDREKMFHGGLGDRSSAAFLRGGPETRAAREVHDLTRVSEFKDRDSVYRRPDVATRASGLVAPSKYGLRGDEFTGHDRRLYEEASSEPVSGRSWHGDSRDGDRFFLRDRDRFADEDDRYRGHRMTRFSSRDDDWDSRDDGLSTVRDTDPVNAARGRFGYSEKGDEYYVRKEDSSRLKDSYMDRGGEFIQDQDHRVGDSYLSSRDSRYGNSDADPYSQEDRLDRDGYSRARSPTAHNITPQRTATPPPSKPEIVKVEDLLCPPNRESRPTQIVTIIRGLPGSGKTYVSKLLREKEISCGGAAPRMLCLDDYFMVDQERDVVDPDTGKKVKKRVLEYEYEQELEDTYRQGLLKSFKKTVDDGFFPFIIIDATNEKVVHFSEFWSYAKSKGFQVYVGELNADVPTCIQRNIHNWTEWDIEKVKNNWEPLPSHYIRLDLRWLLQEDSIPEVVMEDTGVEEVEEDKEADEDDEDSELKGVYKKSKWELDTSEETLDKLDGIRVSKKHIEEHQSLNDYLQLDQLDDDYFSRESLPGKKRVRWADLEEKKNQSRRRNLGFIVGQTQQDWARITDDDLASKALNQTKYFYKN